MTVEAVKRAITDGILAAQQSHATMNRSAAEAADGAELARQVTRGTDHSEVVTALALLDEAARETDLVRRRLTGGIDTANEYRAALG